MRPAVALAVTCAAIVFAACGSSGASDATVASAPATTAAATPAPAATAPARAPSDPCAAGTPAAAQKVPGAPLDTILRVPTGVRGRPAPLVLALHFASGSGAQMEQVTRLTPEARRAGFIVAYPTATSDGFWAGEDEIGAVTRTLQAIERVACIDRRRIYLTGISNGGGMASLLACRFADRFAAAVLFAPAQAGAAGCRPARPVSVLEVHGTADPIVPYAGVPAFVASFARVDGCSGGPRSTRTSAKVTRQRWRGCDGGAVVEHLRLRGGRHIELLPDLRAAGVDPARTAWRFLAPHRVPA